MPSVTVFAPQCGKDDCEVRNSTLYPNALCIIARHSLVHLRSAFSQRSQ